jgi:hypothetical protein
MASLTSTLDQPTSGEKIVAPAQVGPSFLGGLANLATLGVGAFARNSAQQSQIEDRNALNDTTKGIFELQKKFNSETRDGGNLSDADTSKSIADGFASGLPQEAIEGELQLARQKKAQDQGRISREAFDLGMENFISDMEAKHPDSFHLIASYLHDKGYEHYMVRGLETQNAAADSDANELIQAKQMAIKAAASIGLSGSADEMADQGRKVLDFQNKLKLLKEQREEHSAAAAEGRADAEFRRNQTDRTAFSAYGSMADTVMGNIYTTFSKAVTSAGDSPEAIARLQTDASKLIATSTDYKNRLRQQMEAAHIGSEAVNQVMEKIDGHVKAFQDLISGPTSQVANRTRSLTYLNTQFGLHMEESMPFFMWAKKLFGSDAALNIVFNGDPTTALSDELKGKIKTDIMHFDPTRENGGFKILEEMGALAKGDASLADVAPGKLTADHLKGLNASVKGNRERILNPAPDTPEETKAFLGSYGNVVIAANQINPGYKDLKGLDYALNSIAETANVATLDVLMKRPETHQQALGTFMASRGAVQHIFETAKDAYHGTGNDKLVIENGRWVAKVAPVRTNTQMGINPGDYRAGVASLAPSPLGDNQPLKKQAAIMNASVDYLVNTSRADPKMAKFSPDELRKFYMLGTPLPVKEGEKPVSPTWDQDMNQFERQLAKLSEKLPEAMPFKLPLSFASDKDAAVRTVLGEAGSETAAGKKAVAAVILNRAKQSGQSIQDVVLAHNQFEPWSNDSTAQKLLNIDPNSKEYKEAEALVEQAMSGDDPTGGATHFYAPKLQSKLGREKPSFDDGNGTAIGNHLFFKHGYTG